MNNNIILMADVVNSSNYSQSPLMDEFVNIMGIINNEYGDKFLSPITITLGDEFQSVIRTLPDAIDTVINIEETIIRVNAIFKLRYIIYEGKIETEINPDIAYGMLGEGLTKAREKLNMMKSSKHRFDVSIPDQDAATAINKAFILYQDYVDSWDAHKDFPTVYEFIINNDYKKVADELNKSHSQIWKREKTLRIEQYNSTKYLLRFLSHL